MLRRKKWIVVLMCSLILFIAFSVSTGSAHAARSISHIPLNHFTQLKLTSEGPPGCEAIQLGYYPVSVNYSGHKFIVENQLLGWYVLAGDENYHFCDQILCVSNIEYNGGSLVPAGVIGVYCGYNALASKRTNPQGGGDGITSEATLDAGFVTSCARYWIGGFSGPNWNTGGGCLAGQTLRFAPATL